MMKLDIQLFADGKVVIDTELNTKNFENGLNKIESSSQKAGNTIKNIVVGLGITKLISKGLNVISSSIDSAVSRVDTINNFSKVMSNLGVSTGEANKSIDKMSNKLAGLPTTLDQGAMAVQRFTSANGDVKKSTDIFLALNNAILAGGASSEIQASALEQLSQSYAKGKPDMMEWRTAMTAMPAQLKQVAIAMGYVNADELGASLRDGSVSMDQFMDTVIQLNKTGVKGFANFEQQARNSTGGIRTAITVAKTQVTKGVADMIGGINKSLKKSKLGSLSDIIAGVGKEAKKQLDKIANVLSKIDFKKLIDNIKKLIPIVGSLTAGFVAYNTVLKALQIQKAIGNFASLTKEFITLIPAMKGANAATVALNSTFAISPIGLLVAGVAGLTAGFILLNKASEQNATSTQKITKELTNYKNAMEEADKTKQKYLDTHMNEIQNTENLYNELQALVDENGKVKEGYEDRVNFILGELNSALGTEITMTDGVIENYNDMRKSIDSIIESKRAKVLLDAQEEKYNKAKDEAIKLEKAYAKAQGEYNDNLEKRQKILSEIEETYGLTSKQLQEVATTLSYTDENGKKVNLNFEKLGQQLIDTNGKLSSSKSVLDETGEAYAKNQKIIGNYEQALFQFSEGNYNSVLKMYEDTTNYQAKTNEETLKNYQSAIDSQKSYLDYLKKNKGLYNEEVYQKEVAETEKRIKLLEEEQKKMDATVYSGQTKIKGTWNKALAEQLSQITGHDIKFQKTANGNIQAYIDGQKQGAPMTKKQAEKMAEDMTKELKKAKKGSEQAGVDFTSGATNGIEKGKGGTLSAVTSFGSSILSAFKKSLQEHSPSKAAKKIGVNFDKGFSIGVEKEKTNSLKTVKNYGQDMIDELDGIYADMKRTVDIETSKMSANVQTSGTYQLAMSGNPTFNLRDNSTNQTQLVVNGRVLAEVVNTENRNREVAKA